MRKAAMFGFLAMALLVAYSADAGPRTCPMAKMGGGMGGGMTMCVMYDVKTVETISGEVIGLEKMEHAKGQPCCTLIILKAGDKEYVVYTAPEKYLEEQLFGVAKGNKLEVKGSVKTADKELYIVAAEIKKGEKVIKLRDEKGEPLFKMCGHMGGSKK
jgi:hypothetical protein